MVIVTKRKGESKDSMFRKFTRAFIDEDIINTIKNRQFYKKPSLVRQEEEKERIKNRHKKFRTKSRPQYRKI
jgi:ribosomal protein S21